MQTKSVHIIVADDHFVVREGLRSLIRQQPDLLMVGEASNGVEAVEIFQRLKPDIIVMDLRMPLLNGVEATREIRRKDPTARILVLSSLDGDDTIHAALESGAMGYVLKQNSGEQIIPAIRALMEGLNWVPPEVKERLATRNRGEIISTREREILELLSRGEANKQIASSLGISEETVKSHVKNILGKLQARDRTEAVTIAIRRGIIRFNEI